MSSGKCWVTIADGWMDGWMTCECVYLTVSSSWIMNRHSTVRDERIHSFDWSLKVNSTHFETVSEPIPSNREIL